MKRFALVALLAAMLFGVASSASAVELKTRGSFDVYGQWSQNLYDIDSDTSDADNQSINQRARMYFDYISNENLKAVIGFEIDSDWGYDVSYGTDQSRRGSTGKSNLAGGSVEVKHAYLDFTYPESVVRIKAGMMPLALPGVFGSPIFDDDTPAVVVSAPVNDMFSVTAGFVRNLDGATDNSNKLTANSDVEDQSVFLVTPITLDGFALKPYGVYAWEGQEQAIGDTYNIWWIGANAKLSMFDPFTVEADLMYGATAGTELASSEISGWFGALAASYKMDMMTPALFATYGSGDNDDASDGLESMPQASEGFAISPFTGARAFSTTYDSWVLAGTDQEFGTSMWTVGMQLRDITFVEGLTHNLTVAYMQGTSDEKSTQLFDEESSGVEVYLANKYMIYENLAAILEMDYLSLDINDDKMDGEDAAAFVALGFQYKF